MFMIHEHGKNLKARIAATRGCRNLIVFFREIFSRNHFCFSTQENTVPKKTRIKTK